MNHLLKKISVFINEKKLIGPDEKVLVAWSGGPDSTALLSILKKLSNHTGFHVEAFYFNHHSRPDSEKEQSHVEVFSSKHNINLHIISSKNSFKGNGPEDTWRRDRYDAIQKVVEKNEFDKVATGHNLDDNLETLLIRLGRGMGLEGLKGIPVRRDFFIRPLLGIRKSQILKYLSENNIDWYEDPSNQNDLIRASLRKSVIPELKKAWGRYWPKGPLTSLEILSEENQSLNMVSNDLLRIYLNDKGLNREVLKLPPAVALRVIKNWLYSIGVTAPRGALERIIKEGQSKDTVMIQGPPWFKVQIAKNNIFYIGD